MSKIKIAAMADLHMYKGISGNYRHIFEEISKNADILLLCGDLTNDGYKEEAEALAEELSYCKIPSLGILGNHDHTQNQQEEIKTILSPKFMFILSKQDQIYTYKDTGFAGVKGFGGGFSRYIVAPYGEQVLKAFVYESISEALKLEEALMKLETEKKVVLLHYAPIKQTIEGESPEVYNLLGTDRLKEPIENFGVSAVFHGHAHHGKPSGKTPSGIPVYNVSYPLLAKITPDKPYVIVEI